MHKLITALLGMVCLTALAQEKQFTHQDTLKGSITPERAWWDVTHYDLKVNIDPEQEFISGTNTITYKVLDSYQTLQIDLQEPMQLLSATQNGQKLAIKKDGAAYFIALQEQQEKDAVNTLEVKFEGNPVVGNRLPWDGGWTWQEDANGNVFAANANQGIGSSIWWPNKDIPYDEVESMDFFITVPKGLTAVGNGKLIDSTSTQDKTTFHWAVENPINNYGVSADIADYAHFSDTFEGEKGELDLNFYVLKENLEKAKKQFKQVPKMSVELDTEKNIYETSTLIFESRFESGNLGKAI